MDRAVSLPKAVAAYGGVFRALARRIGQPYATVHGWGNAKKGLPLVAQILISQAGIEDGLDVWEDKPKRGARRKKKTTH